MHHQNRWHPKTAVSKASPRATDKSTKKSCFALISISFLSFHTHRIHGTSTYIYLHSGNFYGRCRSIYLSSHGSYGICYLYNTFDQQHLACCHARCVNDLKVSRRYLEKLEKLIPAQLGTWKTRHQVGEKKTGNTHK